MGNDFPIFSTDQQLEMLQGSHIVDEVILPEREASLKLKNSMSSAHKRILEDVKIDDFLKFQYMVNSRGFLLNLGCGYKESTMVPYADMLNHSRYDKNVTWKFCSDRQGFVFVATKDIKRGQEVCSSYGENKLMS